MESKNIGRIRVSDRTLLDWLQFRGGEIVNIERELFCITVITIVHPEMPQVQEGDVIPEVCPQYIRHQDAEGHMVKVREPLKEAK